MAETIKGINVVIGAETTGLSKALTDVNKKSKDIQSELKQVEKLLKLDPTNTELVAQKQKLLTDAVANTKEKLDRLKAAQEQVNQQFAKGDISEGQYRAFQREVAAAEQELSRFETKLEEAGKSANNLGDKLNAAGDKMKGAGDKMSIGLTAPIVAGSAVMLKGAMDAEAAEGKLQASLGLTAKEADRLGDIAKDVWVDGFGENIEEANKAIVTVRQNMGDLADKELQEVTEGALTIAQVFDQDVNEVTRAAGVMMKNFGIDGKTALDLITVGFQKGGDFSGELLDTLREYSPQFVSLGLSADQAMAMLIAGAEAGAWNLDKVGDAMKEFNIRAQDGSKTTADGFAAIGLNAQEMGTAIAKGGEDAQKAFMATVAALAAMEDPVAQNTAGVALFGTQWEDVRAQVIIAMAEGVKGLDDFKGANEEATQAVQDNNPGLALTKSLRELSDAIGPALLPLADILSNTIAPAIKTIADGFAGMSEGGQKVTLAIAGIVAAIGPLLIIGGKAAAGLSTIIGLFAEGGALAGAIAGIGSVLSTIGTALAAVGTAIATFFGAPIALVIAAIAALIAIGVLLYKNWDEIKAFGSRLWEDLKTGWTEGMEAIKVAWTDFGQNIKDTWSNMWGSVMEKYNAIKTDIVTLTTNMITWVQVEFTKFKGFFLGIWEGIAGGVKGYVNSIVGFVNKLIDALNSIQVDIPEWVPQFGGQSFGINIPKVPYLADGGIVTRPTLAMIGEAGAEAIIPLSRGNLSGTVIKKINIYGNNADEIWDKLVRELGRAGVVF